MTDHPALLLRIPLHVGNRVRVTRGHYRGRLGRVAEVLTGISEDEYITGGCRLCIELDDGTRADFCRFELARVRHAT